MRGQHASSVVLLSFAAMLGASGAPHAADAPDLDPIPSLYEEPGLSPNRGYENQHATEYVDPFTGKLQLHYTDLFIPGNGGLQLAVHRSYSSIQAERGLGEPSPFGVGWTMAFGRVLRNATTLLCAHQLSVKVSPVLELPGGNREVLYDGLDESGTTFISPSRYKGVCRTDGTGMDVYAPDGTRYEFTEIGPQVGSATKPQRSWYPSRIVDRNGNWIRFTYLVRSDFLAVSTIDTSDDRGLTFTYVPVGTGLALDTIKDQAHRTWTYRMHPVPGAGFSHFYLDEVERPDGLSWRYTYDETIDGEASDHNIVNVRFPNGGSLDYTYDYVNNYYNTSELRTSVVVHKESSDGGVWTIAYRPGNKPYDPGDPSEDPDSLDKTTVVAPNGTAQYWHFGYAAATNLDYYVYVGRLLRKRVGDLHDEGHSFGLQKISNQFLPLPNDTFIPGIYVPIVTERYISRPSGSFVTTYAEHDEYGNPRTIDEKSDDHARTTTITYQTDPAKWLIRLQREERLDTVPGKIERSFDTNGNVEWEERYGVRTEFTYHSTGDLHTRTNARTFTSTYEDYKRGVPQTEHHPEGVDVSRTVSSAGNIETETDGEQAQTGYGYDDLNRITRIEHPLGNPVAVEWKRTTRTVTRGPYQEVATFDGFGRLTKMEITDTKRGETIVQAYRYNAVGQKTFQSYPGSETDGVTLEHDQLDRLRLVTFNDGSTHERTDLGALVAVTNERTYQTVYRYRAYGDPDRRDLMDIQTPYPDADLEIQRNGLGQITHVKNKASGLTREYGYDPRYFLTSLTEPETGTTILGRDEVGNMISRRVGEGPDTFFGYDGLDRLGTLTYPTGTPSVKRDYYRDNKLKSVDNGIARREYIYDKNKNLRNETLAVDGLAFAIGYEPDGNDALEAIVYGSGTRVSYAPDAFGRPTQATPYATEVTHHPTGELRTLTYANGALTETTLTPRRWPYTLTTSRGAGIVNLTYGYDFAGNMKTITDGYSASASRNFDYDALDRVYFAGGPAGEGSISYDGRGNLRSYAGSEYHYATDERLTSITGAQSLSFAYDRYGNVTSDGVTTFEFDDASNMRCARCGEQDEQRHVYDGAGVRVSSRAGETPTYFVHARSGALLWELTPGVMVKEYVHVDGRQIAERATADGASASAARSSRSGK